MTVSAQDAKQDNEITSRSSPDAEEKRNSAEGDNHGDHLALIHDKRIDTIK